MNKLKHLFERSLLGYAWEEFRLRYRFKYVLPKVKQIEMDGVRLDVSQMSLVARNRLLSGRYEAQEKNMCQQFLAPDDAVLEIGGAIGFIGLFCQKRLGIRNYHVCEANPKTFQMLMRNYELNEIAPRAWNFALADKEGTVELEVEGNFWENTIFRSKHPQETPRGTVPVPAITLEGLLQKIQSKVNVLIVDVEGAEQFIHFCDLPKEVEKIIIELHPKLIGSERTYAIVAELVCRGFRVAAAEEDTFVFLKQNPSERFSELASNQVFKENRSGKPLSDASAVPEDLAGLRQSQAASS